MIHSTLLPAFSNYIDGTWTHAESDKNLSVVNPATGELLAEIRVSGRVETENAITCASLALKTPSSAAERKRWLTGIAEALIASKQEFARIITLEQGKPLAESMAEVDYAAGFFRFFATQLAEIEPRVLSEQVRDLRWTIHHRPTGVAGLITPWNFPLAMMAKKFSAALAADCSIVAKPAELTPLSAIALWHLASEAGIPPGKVNLIIGEPGPIGKALCEHPEVRIISFTGSTQTGTVLLRETAPHLKRLSLELGGNAPFIVFEDADLEAAVPALIANKFRCAGQTCVCTNRVYVHDGVHNRFVDALAERMSKLKVGDGMIPGTDIGPLIHREAFDKVSAYVADALSHGAAPKVGYDSKRPAENWGCYYPVTLLVGLTQEMRIAKEEVFGPVVAVGAFQTEEQAFALANDTCYGLAGYVFTADKQRARRCVDRLKVGHLGVNTGCGPVPEAPFGGMKRSGFGREGGSEGLLEFCEIQTAASGKF